MIRFAHNHKAALLCKCGLGRPMTGVWLRDDGGVGWGISGGVGEKRLHVRNAWKVGLTGFHQKESWAFQPVLRTPYSFCF